MTKFIVSCALMLGMTATAQAADPARPADEKQIKEWIKELGSDNEDVRNKALEKLRKLGNSAISHLVPTLEGQDQKSVYSAAMLIYEIDPHKRLRFNVEDAKRLAPRFVKLAREYKIDPESFNVELVLIKAMLIRIGQPAVPELIQMFKDKDPLMRELAISFLREIGSSDLASEAKLVVPALLDELKAKTAVNESDIVALLKNCPEEGKIIVPVLLERIEKQGRFSDTDFRTLAVFRSEAKTIVPVVRKSLTDGDAGMQSWAAYSLGEFGPEAKSAVPDLVKALSAKPEIRWKGTCIVALGKIGADAEPAVAALTEIAKDKKSNLRTHALLAVWLITKEPGPLVTLKSLAKEKESMHRWPAVSALIEVAKVDAKQIPALIPALRDECDENIVSRNVIGFDGLVIVRDGLCNLGMLPSSIHSHLSSIGPPRLLDASQQETLVAALKDKNPLTRMAAAEMLSQTNLTSKEGLPELLELLKDEDLEVRVSAIRSLSRATKEALLVVPGLIKVLDDAKEEVRLAAVDALGRFGPEAKSAVPALEKMLKANEDNPRVFVRVSRALDRIKDNRP